MLTFLMAYNNLANAAQQHYLYDHNNKLLSINLIDEIQYRILYQYDENGNLLRRVKQPHSNLTGGSLHSAAISEGFVYSWGSNNYGQLGNYEAYYYYPEPTLAANTSNTIAVAAGDFFTLALKKDGTVWSWGLNDYGQLGYQTTQNSQVAAQIPGLSNIIAISVGNDFSIALNNMGEVFTWGSNDCGQLGDGTTNHRWQPRKIAGLSNIFMITAGAYHGMALTNKGDVKAWGCNDSGQLGDGTNTSRYLPVAINGLSSIQTIALGYSHSLALDSKGRIWSWGKNDYGQLGNGTTTNRNTPARLELQNITGISAGTWHSFANSIEGDLYTWGDNSFSQLGYEVVQGIQTTPKVVPLEEKVSGLAKSKYHSLVLLNKNFVWGWGNNSSEQLKSNGPTRINIPTFAYNLMNIYNSNIHHRQTFDQQSNNVDINREELSFLNLLNNSDFEINEEGNISSWKIEGGSSLNTIETTANSESRALQIDANQINESEQTGISQKVIFNREHFFLLESVLNIAELDNATVQLEVHFYNGKEHLEEFELVLSDVTNGYYPVQLRGTAPSFTTTAEIFILITSNKSSGSGKVFVDQMKFTSEGNKNLKTF